MDNFVCPFVNNCTICIVGSSGVGKTTLVLDLIENKDKYFVGGKITKVLYLFGVDDPVYHQFASRHSFVQFTSELDVAALTPGTLLVIDDLQQALTSSLNRTLEEIVTKTVHHSCISVILVLHNLFIPRLRTIALSTSALVLFNQTRDRTVARTLNNQCFPDHKGFLLDVFNYIISKDNRGYIVLDFSVHQNNKFRVRNHVDVSQALFFVPT